MRYSSVYPIHILRCPLTHHGLHALTAMEIDALNERVAAGTLVRRDGSLVQEPIHDGVRSQGGPYIYLIDAGIMMLLPAMAIALQETIPSDGPRENAQGVRGFCGDDDWEKNDNGDYVVAELYEDLRPVSQEYLHRCHMRVKQYLPPVGEFFLDCASGPVQHAEYQTYSADYGARLCVDISLQALREAKQRLGMHGVYILGDMTNLPLQSGVIDGAVSLHTVYHIRAEEQGSALCEFHRVLKPGAAGAVVYSWKPHLERAALLPWKMLRAPFRMLSKRLGPAPDQTQQGLARQRIYFYTHKRTWLTQGDWPFEYDLAVWRSLSVGFMRSAIHPLLLGKSLLALLYWVEGVAPQLCGRLGAYPLIVIHKQKGAAQSLRRAA
ncbi:class I SAM-dependent methyltransferase [Lignipirellula cremea]|uniref:Methyltransferase type 11 domain-containing protein n=1 Tax=Lignipirellula cremea TaxID=2528010 RepID=A0A518E2U7_9BACT|nr:class I SAM-dependent methyltransferase [Lignipirellula cremea]QDU98420.1 hypothetical protein Pla8534_62880 [Lignipirellula cremea]